MKRILLLFLILSFLFCVACHSEPDNVAAEKDATISGENGDSNAIIPLPRGLAGDWSSASSGQLGYTESISFGEDGVLSVSVYQNGEKLQTISGTFRVEGDEIIYAITAGTTPYNGVFEYQLDGRELSLTDSGGTAHYLRTS